MAVFDEPNTACSANALAPTAELSEATAQTSALLAVLMELAFVLNCQRSVWPPESFFTVLVVGETSCALAVPVFQLTVWVVVATPPALFTATERFCVMLTSMLSRAVTLDAA